MKGRRLYKIEKLCSKTVIDRLFQPGADAERALVFPLRVVWSESAARVDGTTCARFLIMVPKRRLRHAVDRVKMRRRIREAYRLNRNLLPAGHALEMAFVYVDNHPARYDDVERAMKRLLEKVARSVQ